MKLFRIIYKIGNKTFETTKLLNNKSESRNGLPASAILIGSYSI